MDLLCSLASGSIVAPLATGHCLVISLNGRSGILMVCPSNVPDDGQARRSGPLVWIGLKQRRDGLHTPQIQCCRPSRQTLLRARAGPDVSGAPLRRYSTEYLHTFDPRKNLNDLFQSAAEEDVRMENLRVYLRLRPSLAGEMQQDEVGHSLAGEVDHSLAGEVQDEDTQVHITDARSVILTAPSCSNTFKNSVRGITKLTHKFTFTHVYGPATTQEELFQSSTFGLITDFISGQNCLLFTYGATNSGKTFTVQGTQEDAGLLPRTVQHIFTVVGEHQYPKNDLKPKFSCNVTRLEEQDVLKEEEKRESIFKITSNLTTTLSQSTMSFLKASICDDTVNSSVQFSETSTISHNTTEAAVSPALDSFNTTNTTNTTTNTTQDSASPATTIYAVFISFAEIYNEYIFDLLEKMPTSKGNKRNPLMLGEDYNGSVYIKGLNEVRVRTPEEALQLVSIGRQNLHFAATRLNHHSSRSHCIFTVKLVRLADADNPHVARVSVLSLCDLAGAERAAKTSSSHDRLKESGNINTSLLTLSRCIEALRCNQAQKGSKKMPVPYRDSKLTRLFQSFLLGG
ncbi:Kinesin-like protein KIF20A [Chionoecetes opilio]|uniref:Kinesin-like protein n=1 Tax=Chionoecetes opilio TaxID=41210 RepID=A0A8J5CRZ8_CHIOP|nr:Kinesin-like protein KIF20A [Chionoecetes opilio]